MHARTSKFDLSLTMVESDAGLEALFEYRTDLFEAQTIERLAAHFVHLLRGIVADPDGPLDRLPLMDAAERHRMLFDWNQRLPAVARELPVHALFRAQARATPEAVALRSGAAAPATANSTCCRTGSPASCARWASGPRWSSASA